MTPQLMDIYSKLYAHFGPRHWWPGDTPFEVALGAVLTQNTNWSNVERAIANLKRARALGAKQIHAMSHDDLAELIRPSGYFNIKARRLKNLVSHIVNEHSGSLKRMARSGGMDELRHELLAINGIGPETADSILLYALDKPSFVIDAYTRRIMSRHGLLPYEAGYEQYRAIFMRNIKPDMTVYNEYHALLVSLGKHFCRQKKPICEGCPLQGIKIAD